MDIVAIEAWAHQNLLLAIILFILLNIAIFFVTRNILARGLIQLSAHTKTKVDDILVKHLQPFRIAWLAPLGFTLAVAPLVPDYQDIVRKFSLFLILWVIVATFNALLNALNEIYESRPGFIGLDFSSFARSVQ